MLLNEATLATRSRRVKAPGQGSSTAKPGKEASANTSSAWAGAEASANNSSSRSGAEASTGKPGKETSAGKREARSDYPAGARSPTAPEGLVEDSNPPTYTLRVAQKWSRSATATFYHCIIIPTVEGTSGYAGFLVSTVVSGGVWLRV